MTTLRPPLTLLHRFLLLAALVPPMVSCQSIHDLGVPNARFDAVRFDQAEVSLADEQASLDVVLAFKVDNPTGVRLWIPRHAYAMRLGFDGQDESAMSVVEAGTRATVSIPPNGERTIEYVVPLSLSPATAGNAAQYLGHEVVYQFDATVDLGPLNPSGDPPRLRHRGTLRLPLPPTIELQGAPQFAFVGELEEFDLGALRSVMTPVAGAINALGVQNIPLLDQDEWAEFMETYNQLQGSIDYPGPDTEGIRVSVPLELSNPNDFPIEVPAFSGAANLANTSDPVLELTLRPASGSALDRDQRTLEANGSMIVTAETIARWKDIGISSLVQGGLEDVEIRGAISVDLGYGPVKIAYP